MPSANGSTSEAARSLHFDAIVINALDSTNEDKFSAEYAEILRAGGIDALNVTVPWVEDGFRESVASYLGWRRRLARLGDAIRIVSRAADITEAKSEGTIGIILGFQNAKPIEDDLALIEVFQRLGIRIIQLSYNRRNYVANGVAEPHDDGLSRFGMDVVRELNRLGILVDLAHVGTRSALDAVEVSTSPVVVSHAAAGAKCSHFRCIPDELVRAVAGSGGVIGVAALSIFLRDDGVTAGSTLEDYLDHLEHMIEVAGIDHVGIGFDVGYMRTDADTVRLEGTYPEFKFPPLHLRYATELNRADKAPSVTEGLLTRGYDEPDIRKILGLNWLRVFSQVWGD